MKYLKRATFTNFRCHASSSIDLEDVNIFAGPNNAGKSALLCAIRRLASVNVYRYVSQGTPRGRLFWGSDIELSLQKDDLREDRPAEFVLELDAAVIDWVARRDTRRAGLVRRPDHPKLLDRIQELAEKGSLQPIRVRFGVDLNATIVDPQGTEIDDGHSEFMTMLHALELLPIVVIPDRREPTFPTSIKEQATPATTVGIIEELVHPDQLLPCLLSWHCESPQQIGEFEDCATRILGARVTVHPQPSSEQLLVGIGEDAQRAMENLGGGIQEVLLVALALTRYDGGLLLFEEPEIHLHPALQRRLVQHVIAACRQGNWQAILTTHSNHVLDLELQEGVALFLVNRSGQASNIHRVSQDSIQDVVYGLGARPSSLNEANAVIWVEGPSDAIYLRYFIQLLVAQTDLPLREFVDYAFAFFGGACLKHVRMAPVPELVSLLKIHPASYVVVDSDTTRPSEELVGKKYTREFLDDAIADRVWVTGGREIESYLHDAVLMWATGCTQQELREYDRVKESFSDLVERVSLGAGRKRPAPSPREKVGFARAVVEYMKSSPGGDWLQPLDLREQITRLIRFIRQMRGEDLL